MAKKLAARPKREAQQKPEVDEAALMEVISKGGSVANDRKPSTSEKEKQTTVPLRLYPSLLAKVQAAVDSQPIKTPRNTWILQAIMEKLERDAATK